MMTTYGLGETVIKLKNLLSDHRKIKFKSYPKLQEIMGSWDEEDQTVVKFQ